MSGEYRFELTLGAEHVDCFRRLRLSALMRIFQSACIAHTEELGFKRDKTLDRGLLWVVNCERMVFSRVPSYGEKLNFVCYPGRLLHYFFPRYMTVTDGEGKVVCRMSAVWALIDEKTRALIEPQKYGIVVTGQEREDDLRPIVKLKSRDLQNGFECVSSYSYCDLNGHFNNACYLDLVTDLIPAKELEEHPFTDVSCVFKKEIRLGERFTVKAGKEEGKYCFECDAFGIELS